MLSAQEEEVEVHEQFPFLKLQGPPPKNAIPQTTPLHANFSRKQYFFKKPD